MTRRDDGHRLPSLRDEVETLFGEVLGLGPLAGGRRERRRPSLDLIEEPERFIVEMDMPGVALPDLQVAVTGRRLTVSGRREGSRRLTGAHIRVHERWSGTFSRGLELPGPVDESRLAVSLHEGILRVELPRRREQP